MNPVAVLRSRLLAACASLWLCACAGSPPAVSQETEPGRLLASISVTESAHAGVLGKKNGFFFYIRTPPGIVGPVLDGYEFRDGKEVDSFGGGSGSAEVIEAIEKIGLAPFDFEREVEDLTARLTREANARGELYVRGARDGAEMEIVIATASGRFELRAWNPGGDIDTLAQYSPNIAKLKAVIDLLSSYYGRLKLGL